MLIIFHPPRTYVFGPAPATVLDTVGGAKVTVDRTVTVVVAETYVVQNADALTKYLESLMFRRQLSALQLFLFIVFY